MDAWQVYLITRLDAVSEFFCAASIVLGVIILGATLFFTMEEAWEGRVKLYVATICIWFVFLMGALLIPTSKQMLIIWGVDYVTHNKRISDDADKTLEYFEKMLIEKIKELDK